MIRFLYLVIVILLSINANAQSNFFSALSGYKGNILYIISGQSNAVGLGESPPAELQGALSNVYMWTGIEFELLEFGVNNEGNKSTQFGIELNLGYLARQKYKNVYIVKNAVGGAPLGDEIGETDSWGKGTGDLYDPMITEVNAAISYLDSSKISFRIGGFYWNQGETDAAFDYLADAYEENLKNFIDDIRADITEAANMPFVVVRLGTQQSRTYLTTVRNAQVSAVGLRNRAFWINQDDLTLKEGDNVHIDGDSQNTLGERFYNVVK